MVMTIERTVDADSRTVLLALRIPRSFVWMTLRFHRVSAHALALNSIIPSCTRGAPTVTKARGSKTQKGRMRWRAVEEKQKVSFVNRVETEKTG